MILLLLFNINNNKKEKPLWPLKAKCPLKKLMHYITNALKNILMKVKFIIKYKEIPNDYTLFEYSIDESDENKDTFDNLFNFNVDLLY